MNENVYTTLGASNHVREERHAEDYYATEPKATELLLEIENLQRLVLEPCVGGGGIAKVLEDRGYKVISTDLYYRGYGQGGVDLYDYTLKDNKLYCKNKLVTDKKFDIVTNPPYKYANSFTEYMYNLLPDGCKLVQFLKLTFLESKSRKELFKKYPLKTLHVSSSRLMAAKNGDFDNCKSSAIAYGWYVWEKGYKGEPVIKWFN